MKTKLELVKNLSVAIEKYSDNKEIRNHMQKVYIEKKMNVRTVGLMFKKEKTVKSLFEIELGIWCIGLFEVTSDHNINPNDYFSQGEQNEISTYQNKSNSGMNKDEILLHNVTKRIIKGKTYYCCAFIENNDLFFMQNNSQVTYNFETQRDAKLTNYGNKIFKQENVNLQSVDEISKLTEVDELPISMLTLNIRDSEAKKESVVFNEDTGDLIIKISLIDSIYADCIDGYHRLIGIVKGVLLANANNVHLDGGMMLLVTSYTPEECQSYIQLQNTQNKMKSEQIKAFTKDSINEFVKALNHTGSITKNVMYDKIANTMDEVNMYKDKYTTVNILHDALKLTDLKFGKPYENEKFLTPHFIFVMNTILGYYMHEYKDDIKKLKADTILLEPNSFVLYIALGKELYEKENKKELLDDILENKLDLKRNSFNWGSLDLFKKNPHSYKKIYDYAINIAKEVE